MNFIEAPIYANLERYQKYEDYHREGIGVMDTETNRGVFVKYKYKTIHYKPTIAETIMGAKPNDIKVRDYNAEISEGIEKLLNDAKENSDG